MNISEEGKWCYPGKRNEWVGIFKYCAPLIKETDGATKLGGTVSCVSTLVGILHRAYGKWEGTQSLKQLHKGIWNPLCIIFPMQESHWDMSKKVNL